MRMIRPTAILPSILGLALAASWGAGACNAQIDGDTDQGSAGRAPGAPGQPRNGAAPGSGLAAGSGPVGPAGAAGAPQTQGVPAPAGAFPLRRLTGLQYFNTLRDLLGDAVVQAAVVPRGAIVFGETALTDPSAARLYHDLARKAAAAAVADLPRVLGCDPQGPGETACVTSFVTTTGRRAYRRPLLPDEQTAYLALYADVRKNLGHDVREATRVLLQVMVESPFFLYRWELGPVAPRLEDRAQGLVRLGPYEAASRLSYFLWNSMPDAALFDAAASKRLGTHDELLTQLRRMLDDPRAATMVEDFHLAALGTDDLAALSKSASKFPEFGAALTTSMTNETRGFVRHVVFERKETTATLLSATFSFVDTALGKLYDLGRPIAAGASIQELNPAQRAGLLTQAGFLARHAPPGDTNPVKRGKAVYERILCGSVPPPPPDVPAPKPPAPGLTTRERFAEHGRNECARACHEIFDPIGFAFENYDALGKFRSLDSGKPVDPSGEIVLPRSGARHRFANAVELAAIIARSDDAERCMAGRWAVAALGRAAEERDIAAVARPGRPRPVLELLADIASANNFIIRTLSAGEITQ